MDFADWVETELQTRGWSRSEYARQGKLTTAQVSRVLTKQQSPGSKFIEGTALAFGYPLDLVYRKAGKLPPAKNERSEILEKIRYELSLLSEKEQERWWLRIKAEREINKRVNNNNRRK